MAVLQLFQQIFSVRQFLLREGNNLSVNLHDLHNLFPVQIDLREFCAFSRQVLPDIWRGKNRLQIEPHALNLHPVLREIEREIKPVLPLSNLPLKNPRVRGPLHGLGLHDLIVEDLLDLVDRAAGNDESAGVPPGLQLDVHGLPVVDHFPQNFLYSVLLGGVVGDFFQLGEVLPVLLRLDLLDCERLFGCYNRLDNFADLLKMPFFQSLSAEASHEWHVFLKIWGDKWR